MRLRVLSSTALLLACSLVAAPAARAGAGDDVAHLTVYDAGIAQFLEERTVALQPGLNTVEWRSLMPRAFLRTLRVTVEGADLVRQNVTMDGPEVGDSRTPVLHLVIDNKGAAGARRVRVDYLAPGLKWQNDYALVLEPGAGGAPPTSATLDAWVAVHNDTGADLTAGVVDLVAGDISLLVGDGDGRRHVLTSQVAQNVASFDSSESVSRGELGALGGGLSAFNRFTLGRDIRLMANAPVNRFPLFQRARIAVEERKVFESAYNEQTLGRGDFILLPRGLEVRIVSKNTTGAPMPAGLATIYTRSGELAQIVGQDRIGFNPQGVDFSVSQGRSTTLLGTRRIVDRQRSDYSSGSNLHDKLTTKVEVTLTNRGTMAAEAYVREGVEQFADNRWTILESTHQSERLGANTLQFRVMVPAGGTTTVAYTVEVR